jgi:hypothetical protein
VSKFIPVFRCIVLLEDAAICLKQLFLKSSLGTMLGFPVSELYFSVKVKPDYFSFNYFTESTFKQLPRSNLFLAELILRIGASVSVPVRSVYGSSFLRATIVLDGFSRN